VKQLLLRTLTSLAPPVARFDVAAFSGPPRIVKVYASRDEEVLRSLAGPKNEDGVSLLLPCDLVPQPPKSAADIDRIAVMAKGKVLAHLGHESVPDYYATLAAQGQSGAILTGLKARIYGGWETARAEGAYLVDVIVPESLAYALSVRGRTAA